MIGAPNSDFRPEAPELFISYASANLDRAAALATRFAAEGFRVWLDKARLSPGCDWHREIEKGCEASRIVVPLLTPSWKLSEWTRYETYGHATVIPLIAEGTKAEVLTAPLRRWQAQRFDPLTSDEHAWRGLLTTIRAKLAEPPPDRAARLIRLAHDPCSFFTGREADLLNIHEELHEGPVAALTQGRVRALAAMGGVGKTTLANEYARRFWRLYPQIFWVDARAGLESGFALLFEKLFPDRAGEDLKQPDKARLALAELSGKPERLLVIDNVEDAESVRPWLPRDTTTGCRTLITSRFSDWPLAAGIRSITLYVLEPEPSRQFLLARTGRTAEGAELAACDDLAKALDYLPLALEQAAAYMAAPGAGVGFAGYLRLYEAAAAELLARKALGSTEYPDAVITTWQATVAKLSPESCAVLRLCAWYADTPIPRALVMGGAKEVLALAAGFGPVMPLSGPAAAELRMRDALTGLARYSMIMDATDTTFRVHGLVQTVERVRAEQEQEKTSSLDGALASIEAALPSPEWDQKGWRLWEQLAPHCRILLNCVQDHVLEPKATRIMNDLAVWLNNRAEHGEAESLFRRALAITGKSFGPEHPDVATGLNNLALLLRATNRLAEAESLFRRALTITEKSFGPAHPDVAKGLNNLALLLSDTNRLAEAEPLFRRALTITEKSFGPEHPDVAIRLNNLAGLLSDTNRPAEAEPLFRRALAITEKSFGPEHPDVAIRLNNLAGLLSDTNRLTEAEPLFRRALAIVEKSFGPAHPNVAKGLNNLALLLRDINRLAEAEPLFRRALAITEKSFGPEHPNVATGLNHLAGLRRATNRLAEAEPLLRRALAIDEKSFGSEHPNVATSLNNLAGLLRDTNRLAEAEPLYRRALAITEKSFGPEHPNVATGLSHLAGLRRATNRLAEAEPLLRRALAIFEKSFGPEHPNVAASLNNLAWLLRATNRLAEAEPLFRRALAIDEKSFGSEHPNVATSLNNLAGLLRDTNRLAEAEPLFRRALRILAEFGHRTGHEHPHFRTAINNYAGLISAMGLSQDAIAARVRTAIDGEPEESA